MPTLWAHTNYFATTDTTAPTPLGPTHGGYPLWQASNSAMGTLLGGFQPFWERFVLWLRSWRRRQTPVKAPQTVLDQAEALLQHPAYPYALEAVKKTATTLGFNRPEAWQGLSRHMKSSPGRAENVFRHLEACRLTRESCGSTLTNPDCNLLVELAYHEFARKGR